MNDEQQENDQIVFEALQKLLVIQATVFDHETIKRAYEAVEYSRKVYESAGVNVSSPREYNDTCNRMEVMKEVNDAIMQLVDAVNKLPEVQAIKGGKQ